MNERIQELLVEAHRQTKGGIYNGHLSEWSERFAELIVRECAKISLECGINLNREDFRQGIARNIKQHFGVKQ